MKKKLILMLFGVGLLFSMGFLPAVVGVGSETLNSPMLKPTSSAPVELFITNQSSSSLIVYIWGTQNYYLTMPKGPKVTRSIKVNPAKYYVLIHSNSGDCKSVGKNVIINKKTKLSFACGKFK